jgi:hypothetical protein
MGLNNRNIVTVILILCTPSESSPALITLTLALILTLMLILTFALTLTLTLTCAPLTLAPSCSIAPARLMARVPAYTQVVAGESCPPRTAPPLPAQVHSLTHRAHGSEGVRVTA